MIKILALFTFACATFLSAQVGPNGEVDGLTAKFVDINGVRTRYYDCGQGDAIVLVHGGYPGSEAGSANGWSRNIRALARKFRVLALDRLAQGMTDAPKEDKDFGIAGQVEHVYQFIRAMKLDKVHLVGSSSAADNLTLAFALEHPEIVKTLIWVSGGAGFRNSPSKFLASFAKCPTDPLSAEYQKCRMAARAPLPRTFSPEDEKASEWMWNLPRSVEIRKRLAAIRAAGTQSEAEERAYRDRILEQARSGALQVPILMYKGKQDVFDWDADAPHASMQGALNLFDMVGAKNPRVKLMIINDASHFVNRDQPEQFNADLIQFIEFWNNKLTVTPNAHSLDPQDETNSVRGRELAAAPWQNPSAFNEALLAFLARSNVKSLRVNDYNMAYVVRLAS